MAEQNPLATIPVEIEDQIIGELEPLAAISLSKVSRHYHEVVSLHRLDKEVVRSWLHELEMSSPQFACFTCLRLKPRDDFTVKNTKLRRGKNGTRWFERCCVSCGLEKGIFTPGNQVTTKDGQDRQLICIGCKILTPDFCGVCLACRECAERADVRALRQYFNAQVGRREFCRGMQLNHSWNQRLPPPTMPMYDYVSGSEGSASPTRSDYSYSSLI